MFIVHLDSLEMLSLYWTMSELWVVFGSREHKIQTKSCVLYTWHISIKSLFCSFFPVHCILCPHWLDFEKGGENEQTQQDPRELENSHAAQSNQTVAQLGSVPFAVYDRDRCGRVTFLTRLAPSDHLVTAQPNPIRSSSFSPHFSFSCVDIFILLLKLLRAHYLRGRNVALIVWWLQSFRPLLFSL